MGAEVGVISEDEPRVLTVDASWRTPKAPLNVEVEDVLVALLMGIGAGSSIPVAGNPRDKRLVAASDCCK